MQLAVRLAATLLALTRITSVAQAASALRDFTLIYGTHRDPVRGSARVGSVCDVAQDIKSYTRESVHQQLRINAAYCVTAVQVLGADHTVFGIRGMRAR